MKINLSKIHIKFKISIIFIAANGKQRNFDKGNLWCAKWEAVDEIKKTNAQINGFLHMPSEKSQRRLNFELQFFFRLNCTLYRRRNSIFFSATFCLHLKVNLIVVWNDIFHFSWIICCWIVEGNSIYKKTISILIGICIAVVICMVHEMRGRFGKSSLASRWMVGMCGCVYDTHRERANLQMSRNGKTIQIAMSYLHSDTHVFYREMQTFLCVFIQKNKLFKTKHTSNCDEQYWWLFVFVSGYFARITASLMIVWCANCAILSVNIHEHSPREK